MRRTDLRLLNVFLVMATLLSCPGVFAQRVQVPPASRHVLDNGLTLILMQYRKVPVVHLRLVARGGSASDPKGTEGLAAVTTSLMREGTTSRTSSQLAQEIDFIGGSLSAAAGLDYCVVNGQMLKKDLEKGLELFADVVLRPTFPAEELKRERKQRLANLDALKENPGGIATIMFNKHVYGPHAYGVQAFGTRASLQQMTREQLQVFYKGTFVPNNSILVVVGDMEPSEMLGKITAKFGNWNPGTKIERALPLPQKVTGEKVVLVNKHDATQTQIRIGNVGVDVKHPDNFAIDVANGVFGDGFTSRLVDELRVKRSLTYGAGSSFQANLFGGKYQISTFTKNETLGKTIDVILEELKKFREKGATDEEVRKAQNYLSGSFARSLQTPEALAANITDIELYGFPKDYLETYIPRLKAVTGAEVLRAAREYFLVNDLLMVFVGPAEQAKPELQRHGAVDVIELKDAIE